MNDTINVYQDFGADLDPYNDFLSLAIVPSATPGTFAGNLTQTCSSAVAFTKAVEISQCIICQLFAKARLISSLSVVNHLCKHIKTVLSNNHLATITNNPSLVTLNLTVSVLFALQ